MKNNLQETTVNNARVIHRDLECRKKISEAIECLSIVGRTLGPGGLPIFIERKKLPPLSTKDGVSVAKEIYHPERDVNTIIQAIKEASVKTNDEAGDGTTTAIVLTEAIYTEGRKLIDAGLCQPNDLANSLSELEKVVNDFVVNSAIQIRDDKNSIKNVAYISCNGDESISNVVLEAFDRVGEDGVITVDEGIGKDATLRIEEGYQINRGIDTFDKAAIYLITDKFLQEAILEKPKILLYGGTISDVNQLASCLQSIATNRGETNAIRMPVLAIVAYEFKPAALDMIIQNRVQAGLPIIPIQLASHGTRSQEGMIEDIAIMTNGKAIFPAEMQLADVGPEHLGSCDKIVSTMRHHTTFYGPHGAMEDVVARIDVLKKQLDDADFQYDKDNIRERIGKLIGGIAVIGVGGATDLERKERKHRVEDAIHATRDALEEGVVPGCGATLLRAAKAIDEIPNLRDAVGAIVLKRALAWPITKVLKNAGFDTEIIIQDVYSSKYETFDARNGVKIDDAIRSGIIDPVKVVRSSFKNAISIAKELLKSGGILSYVKQPELDDQYHNSDE